MCTEPMRAAKWYNTHSMNMSGEMLVGCAAEVSQVRYSAAYFMGAERVVKRLLYPGG